MAAVKAVYEPIDYRFERAALLIADHRAARCLGFNNRDPKIFFGCAHIGPRTAQQIGDNEIWLVPGEGDLGGSDTAQVGQLRAFANDDQGQLQCRKGFNDQVNPFMPDQP